MMINLRNSRLIYKALVFKDAFYPEKLGFRIEK